MLQCKYTQILAFLLTFFTVDKQDDICNRGNFKLSKTKQGHQRVGSTHMGHMLHIKKIQNLIISSSEKSGSLNVGIFIIPSDAQWQTKQQ